MLQILTILALFCVQMVGAGTTYLIILFQMDNSIK